MVFMGGSNITTIGNRAFYNCGVYGIELPASVKFIGKQAFTNSVVDSITLRSYVYVEEGAFDSFVTVYTDAKTAPSDWHFLNGNYIFFNCELSEAGNYVEAICVQERNGFTGKIYDPYRQFSVWGAWAPNQVVDRFIIQYNELVSYSLDEIIDGALPVGKIIYTIFDFPALI